MFVVMHALKPSPKALSYSHTPVLDFHSEYYRTKFGDWSLDVTRGSQATASNAQTERYAKQEGTLGGTVRHD